MSTVRIGQTARRGALSGNADAERSKQGGSGRGGGFGESAAYYAGATAGQHPAIHDGSLDLSSHAEATSWVVPSHLMHPFPSSSQQGTCLGPFFAQSETFGEGGNGPSIIQQDLFYPPTTSSVDPSPCDFSFLSRRPVTSCSQLMKPYTPMAMDTPADVSTAYNTPSHIECESAISRMDQTSTPKASARRPALSNQRSHRRMVGAGTSRTATSAAGRARSSSITQKKVASMFANTKRLPLRLPAPPLCLISDPHADLCTHLRRHGMDVEADEFANAGGITTDFALRSWIQTSLGGAAGLLNQTNVFLDKHGQVFKMRMEALAQSAGGAVPARFDVPVADLDSVADDNCLTPTHILAVHGTGAAGKGDDDGEAKGLLVPCHALMYALQCVSLPAFPTATSRQEDERERTLPVVSLRVPRPAEYPTLHRYVYTHDASALLVELLPMKHIARYWDQVKLKQYDPMPSHLSNQLPRMNPTPTLPNSATDALSHLPTPTLFNYAYKIHSAWANGVAIGFIDAGYWSTLDRAWNLVMAALSIKKARILDVELRGVQLELGKSRC